MITKALLRDVPELVVLINSAFRGETSRKGWTTEAHLLDGKRTDQQELAAILMDPKNTILKFTQDNKIIGSVLLSDIGNHMYLGMLTVFPELQNNGTGKKLLAEAENYARFLGISNIIMSVISVREELLGWYKRHGYVDTGEWEDFPDSDIYTVMCESLKLIYLEKKIEVN